MDWEEELAFDAKIIRDSGKKQDRPEMDGTQW